MKLSVKSNLPEAKKLFEICMADPAQTFDLFRIDFKSLAEKTISEMLKVELNRFLGRSLYERSDTSPLNHRNGSYQRNYTVKNIGELKINVPRDRQGEFNSKLVKKYDRYEKSIEQDICLMFLSGLSTRSIELVSKAILGRKISKSEVSLINEQLLTGIDAWRNRDLSQTKIKYVYVDGVNFHMRIGHKIEIVPMLVVIGVTLEGKRTFLAIQQGDKESATTWREVFKDVKSRGLDKTRVELGIMDGLSGLMKVFREEFPSAKIQRCQVHVARNVLSKVSKTQKQAVADKVRDIFYASSKAKALEYHKEFISLYEKDFPSATLCLTNVIDECLTYHSFPEEEWRSLRTTNLIERVNKEFKRRTKPMEILAGEKSAYRLLCFIALKMEIGWRTVPIDRNLSMFIAAGKLLRSKN